MESHYENFVATLYRLVYDINRYAPNDEVQKVLEIYNKLDFARVIFRVYNLLQDNLEQIIKKDEMLFGTTFILLPGIDLSQIWGSLSKGQKTKIWTYLTILNIESDILMSLQSVQPAQSGTYQITQNTTQTTQDVVQTENINNEQLDGNNEGKQLSFNPYEGIGQSNTNYGVDEMYASLENIDDDTTGGPGLESVIKMIGIDKMVNMEELQEKLKNMKKEDIDEATNTLKNMLGDGADEKTTALISDMLTNISNEMKNDDMNNTDPIKNFMHVAEKVAEELKPRINRDNIDIAKLINSAQSCATKCTDQNGKPLFQGKVNPFALLGQLANMGNANISEEECKNQCNEMLNSMGANLPVDFMMRMATAQSQNRRQTRQGKKK